MSHKLLSYMGAGALALILGTPGLAVAAPKDIVDTAVEAGSFKTLAAALKAADLVGALKGKGPFTVFAPTDDAFKKIPEATLQDLLKPENKATLSAILTYHVVSGSVPAKTAVGLSHAETLQGQRIDLALKGKELTLDGKSKVIKTDIECSNGVIHVIDTVIMPTTDDLLTVAGKAGFKTLGAAIKAAGLVAALQGEGPFTVFAPTDDAFKAIESAVQDLLKPENKAKLQAVLKLHVVSGRIYSDLALSAGKAKTLQGGELKIAVKDGKPTVAGPSNSAGIVKTDVEASNGVIHVIDTVLLP